MTGTWGSDDRWSGMPLTFPSEAASFAPDTRGQKLSRLDYWWGKFVDDQMFLDMVREIEALKGRQSGHEQECVQFRRNIETQHSAFNKKLDEQTVDIKAIRQMQQDSTQGAGKTMMGAMAFAISLLLAMVAWTGGQLYQLEPSRVAEASPAK